LLATVALRYVSQNLISASGDQDHTISLVREDVFVGAAFAALDTFTSTASRAQHS
jgi:hypothetical protein